MEILGNLEEVAVHFQKCQGKILKPLNVFRKENFRLNEYATPI